MILRQGRTFVDNDCWSTTKVRRRSFTMNVGRRRTFNDDDRTTTLIDPDYHLCPHPGGPVPYGLPGVEQRPKTSTTAVLDTFSVTTHSTKLG